MSKELLNATLFEMMGVIHADCGSLFLFDSENKELVLDVFRNSERVDICGFRQRIGEGISGKVAHLMRPVLVKDIDGDGRFRRNGFTHYRTKSFISLPIFCSGKLFGLINLADKSNGKPFSDEDLNIAATIVKCTSLALDSQNRLLERCSILGKLVAGAVHEINNPLDGVTRFINILLKQRDSNPVTQEYLVEVNKGLERIAHITKSLRLFYRLINSTGCDNRKYVNLHALIQESLNNIGQSDLKAILISKKFNQGIGKILDMGLSNVIDNLMKNAIDAMPGGGELEILTDLDDKWLRICFKDTGMGISDEVKPHIFEPFFTTKPVEKGAGLGLVISREIIAKYEGSIKVESALDKGSCFDILIPRRHLENA